jgi:hypothetical protein
MSDNIARPEASDRGAGQTLGGHLQQWLLRNSVDLASQDFADHVDHVVANAVRDALAGHPPRSRFMTSVAAAISPAVEREATAY